MAKTASSPILQLIRRSYWDPQVKDFPDQWLLRRFLGERDEAAFEALLRRHGPMVLDVCRSVLGNETDAEDAFQATFLILSRKAGSIRKAASLASWLHGVAYRTALRARADSARRHKHEARAPQRSTTTEPDELSWREVHQAVHEELDRLSERQRAALVLCYLEGKTQDEAAAQLGLAKGTLKGHLERGRALLRARLVRRGLGPGAVLVLGAWAAATASASVPLSLMVSTVKAASLVGSGQAAAMGPTSAQVAALTEGVLKAMLLSKMKPAIALVLMLSACVGATLTLLPTTAAQNATAKKTQEDQKEVKETAAPLKATFPDLTKIDRTIVKEPKYTRQPYYALLAIGAEAKKRVWLVVDGETLYVDRNGNGDLTEASECVALDKTIAVAPGMYEHMNSFYLGEVQGLRLRLDFWVRDKKFVPQTDFDKDILKGHQENGWEFATLFRVNLDGENIPSQIPVAFCRQAKDAQICHLAGRLTFALRSNDPLERHSDKNILQVKIGTPGLPARKWSDPVFAPLGTNEVPAGMHPVARFEFPLKDATQPPIKLEAMLNQRC